MGWLNTHSQSIQHLFSIIIVFEDRIAVSVIVVILVDFDQFWITPHICQGKVFWPHGKFSERPYNLFILKGKLHILLPKWHISHGDKFSQNLVSKNYKSEVMWEICMKVWKHLIDCFCSWWCQTLVQSLWDPTLGVSMLFLIKF